MPEANELVLKAAKAGTTMGNVLPGLLCEKIGDLKHAEEWLRRIDPEDSDELVTFYGRHRDDPAHPEYLEKYQEGFAKYFPDGPEPATLVQFAGKPVEGFRFKFYPHPYVINAGIHPAAVIVAVNGQRVRNLDQFNFLGDSTLGSAFQAIIWQDGKYQTVTVPAKPAIGWDFE